MAKGSSKGQGASELALFLDMLMAERGATPHTIDAYTRDVRLFSQWFFSTNGKTLSPETITPIDVREYRSHLLVVKNHKPATVNRKLASLSAFCVWAREAGMIPTNPVKGISQVDQVRPERDLLTV